MAKKIISVVLMIAIVLGMIPMHILSIETSADIEITDSIVFAPYGTPKIDGKLDADSSLYNLNTIWLMNAKIGNAPFGAMWDHDYLYLAIDTADTGAVTVNGIEVATVDGAVREAKVALGTLGIQVSDYNDTAELILAVGETTFAGTVSFTKDTAMFFDAAAPVASVTCGATATATRTSDYSTLTFGLDAGTASHTGWVGHTIYSSKTITRGMPTVTNGVVASDDVHVLEFDFMPMDMPVLSATYREGYWYEKTDYNPVNGFNLAVQYDASVTAPGTTDYHNAGTGHAYAAGIVNRGGVLTLVIRTPWTTDGCATLFPIAEAGQWDADDIFRMRFEYDFSTGMLSVWADGNFVGKADPTTIKISSSSNVIRFSLYSINKVGHWSGDCPSMKFVIANAHSGMKENDSALTSDLMDALAEADILGQNSVASDVTKPLALTEYLPHSIFNGIGLNWTSSDETVITNDGKVTRGESAKTVTLTAALKSKPSVTKSFEFTVPGIESGLALNALYNTQVNVDSSLSDGWDCFSDIEDGRRFAAQWDKNYVYLAVKAAPTDEQLALTINGQTILVTAEAVLKDDVEVANAKVVKNANVWELAIPFSACNINLTDYNQSAKMTLALSGAVWNGKVFFTDSNLQTFVPNVPTVKSCTDSTGTGSRSADNKTINFKLVHNGTSHSAWTTHQLYSVKNNLSCMPALDSTDNLVSVGTHILEFDFTATDMPSYQGWWNDRENLYICNGFLTGVQFNNNVSATVGHGYTFGITNLNGDLTLVVRTAKNQDGKYGDAFSLGALGIQEGDQFHLRLEYDFAARTLNVWADGMFVGSSQPLATKWGSTGKMIHFDLYDMSKAGTVYAGLDTMEFAVSNVYTGQNLNSIYDASFLDVLKETDLLGGNSNANAVVTDLELPTYLDNAVFGRIPLTWSSSNDSVISSTGVVKQGETAQTVTLTVKLTDKPSISKSFQFTVSAQQASVDQYVLYRNVTVDGSLADGWDRFIGISGDRSFAASWDKTYLYLAVKAQGSDDSFVIKLNEQELIVKSDAVMAEGNAVSDCKVAKNGNIFEVQIPLSLADITLTDYNQTAKLQFVFGSVTWNSKLIFAEVDSKIFVPNVPVVKTCSDSTGAGSRSEDKNTINFKLDHNENKHTAWTTHSLYSNNRDPEGMPQLDSNDNVLTDGIHVLEFDFSATNLPEQKAIWNDRASVYLCNGFITGVQFNNQVSETIGHGYTFGITNLNGDLTLVVRTAKKMDGTYCDSFSLGALGYEVGESFHIRSEYDFTAKMVSFWIDGIFVGSTMPLGTKWSSTGRLIRFDLYDMSKDGTAYAGFDSMEFSVSNIENGMFEETVFSQKNLDALKLDDILGSNTSADAVVYDLDLPATIEHHAFGKLTLKWQTTDSSVITADGIVADVTDEKLVNMIVSYDGHPEVSRSFPLKVIPADTVSGMQVALYSEKVVVDGLWSEGWERFVNIKNGGSFAAMWDKNHLYLAYQAVAGATSVDLEINGVALKVDAATKTVTGVKDATVAAKGNCWEIKIPLSSVGYSLNDYNQTIALLLRVNKAIWEGNVRFAKEESDTYVLYIPVAGKGNYCPGSELTGTRTEDYSSISYKFAHEGISHTDAWMMHLLYSTRGGLECMPLLDDNDNIVGVDTHVLEFDFTATDMPEYTSWWNDRSSAYPCNGFVTGVQFNNTISADAGHSYTIGITNLNGDLTFVVRTAQNEQGTYGDAFSLGALGIKEGDTFRLRLEYDFVSRTLRVWANEDFVGESKPLAVKWSSSGRLIRFDLHDMSKAGPDYPGMEFTVSNVTSGAFEGSIHSQTVLDLLTEENILGKNTSLDIVSMNLVLPEKIEDPLFGDVELVWESSDPSVIKTNGSVSRGSTNKEVTLTVYLKSNPDARKTFTVKVMKYVASTVFANFLQDVKMDGYLDDKATLRGELVNSAIGSTRDFDVRWDGKNIYLYIKYHVGDSAVTATVNGETFRTGYRNVLKNDKAVIGSYCSRIDMWEIRIPFDAANIKLKDYNQSVPLKLKLGNYTWSGNVCFEELDSQEHTLQNVGANTDFVTKKTVDAGYQYIITHPKESTERYYGLTRVYGIDSLSKSQNIHVLEFDFNAANMPDQEVVRNTSLSVDGFVAGVQYGELVTADNGHGYSAAIAKLNGQLCLVVYTGEGKTYSAAYPLHRSEGQTFHVRLEYDFANKSLEAWVDNEFLGEVNPKMTQWTSNLETSKIVCLYAIDNNSSGNSTGMNFTVTNLKSGTKQRTAYSSETLRFLNVGNLFGEDNFDANMIFSDLKLPNSVVHPAFGEFAISWNSSNANVISKDGKINLTDTAQPVTMTAAMKAVAGARKSFDLTVCDNTAVINALLTEENMRIDGKLDEYTWMKWNEFVSRSVQEPQGTLAVSWNRTDMFLALVTEDADRMQMQIGDQTVTVDLLSRTVEGAEDASVVRKGNIAEIRIPLKSVGISLSDYSQLSNISAKLYNNTGASILPCGQICFSGRVAKVENFTQYTKMDGWIGSGTTGEFNGMEDDIAHAIYCSEIELNRYNGMEDWEYEEFIENYAFDTNLSITLNFNQLPVSTGQIRGTLNASGFYYWCSRNSGIDEVTGGTYGDVYSVVIYNAGRGKLMANVFGKDADQKNVIYKTVDLGVTVGETFRLDTAWELDGSIRLYVNSKLVADVENATYFVKGCGEDSVSFRYRSDPTEKPQNVQINLSRVLFDRGVYQTVSTELDDPYAILNQVDLARLRENLPMNSFCSSKYFDSIPVRWETTDSSVIEADGTIHRGEEDGTADISLYYNDELLWSRKVTVQSIHSTDAKSPALSPTGFTSQGVKVDGSIVGEVWLLPSRILKDGIIYGYMGAQWNKQFLYMAIENKGAPIKLTINGKDVDLGKITVAEDGNYTELEIPMEYLNVKADYDMCIPVEIDVDGGTYQGQLQLLATEWWAAGNSVESLPVIESNHGSIGRYGSIPTENQNSTALPTGWHQFDLYDDNGNNPNNVYTYTVFGGYPVYDNLNNRTGITTISFDVQIWNMPALSLAEALTGQDSFACYGLSWAFGDKYDSAKYCYAVTGGIFNTDEGLYMAVGGNAIDHIKLDKQLGDLFRVSYDWYPNGDLEVFIDGESLGYFENRQLWATNLGGTTTVIYTLRDASYPNSDEDNIDAYITNMSMGRAFSGEILDTLTWDVISGENEMISSVKGNLNLVKQLDHNEMDIHKKVTWTSSDSDMIDPENGKVTRPQLGAKQVTLTATLEDGRSKSFDVVVIGLSSDPGNILVEFWDTYPETGEMEYNYITELYKFDGSNNSLGIDLGKTTKVNVVRLTDLDSYARLNRESLRLYVSDDNLQYTEIEEYKLLHKGQNWYLYDFEAEARFVKVHYTHFDTKDCNFITPLHEAMAAYWEDVIGIGSEKLKSTEFSYTNTSDYAMQDEMVRISKSEYGITGNDASIRVYLDGGYLFHYVDGDDICVRVPDIDANATVVLTVKHGVKNAMDIANKEAVYEITYGTRESYLTTTERYLFTLPAGTYTNGTVERETLIANKYGNFTASYDGGDTWEQLGKLTDDVAAAAIDKGEKCAGGWMFDDVTGRILFMTHRASDHGSPIFGDMSSVNVVVYSDDFGKTWKLADVLEPHVVDPDPYAEDDEIEYNYSLGYADGIKTSVYDGEGPNVDFVIPVGTAINGRGSFNAMVAYSCDSGITWQYSENMLTYGGAADTKEGGVSEGWMMESDDHALVLYCRAQAENMDFFCKFYSYDFGVTWTNKTREKWEATKDDPEFSKEVKGVRSMLHTTNTQPVLFDYHQENGIDAPIFLWAGNNASGGTSYIRSPLNVAVSYDDLATWRNIQNMFSETFMEGYRSAYSHYVTNPSLGQVQDDELAIIFHNSWLGIIRFSVTDFEDWFYRTKGAYDSFESGTPQYEGWISVSGSATSTKDVASDGEHAMRVGANATVTRSIPYFRAGDINFKLYVDKNTQLAIELQPTFARDQDEYAIADIVIENMKMTCGEVSVDLVEGWNSIELNFQYDHLTMFGFIGANGSEPQRVRLNKLAGDYICYVTMFTKSSVYMDEFLVASSMDAEVFTANTEIAQQEEKKLWDADNKAKAKPVIDLIKAIGKLEEVTLDSESAINTAREAYNKLTYGQQDEVDNYNDLVEAEKKIAVLKQETMQTTKTIVYVVVASAAVLVAVAAVLVWFLRKKNKTKKIPESE